MISMMPANVIQLVPDLCCWAVSIAALRLLVAPSQARCRDATLVLFL
jgi:hypothetical protein